MQTQTASGYQRLEDQIKSIYNQKWFKRLKYLEILCAALIPLIATQSALVTGLLGALIVFLEAFQHINQFQHNWIIYRSNCEALRHEKYLYIARSSPYNLPDEEAKKELAKRVESLISTEHAKWVTGTSKADHTPKIT
jgi:hypothetical protein